MEKQIQVFDLTKSYHFYAAHRNEQLKDKCFNIHGHTYHVDVTLKVGKKPNDSVTILFSDVDAAIEPIIKQLDHSMLINQSDPLLAYLESFQENQNQDLKLNVFPFATSVENMTMWLFAELEKLSLPVSSVSIKETESSQIVFKP